MVDIVDISNTLSDIVSEQGKTISEIEEMVNRYCLSDQSTKDLVESYEWLSLLNKETILNKLVNQMMDEQNEQ